MGFDISFHPLDVDLIRDRLVPFVRGGRSVDDLLEEIERITDVWAIARARALGILTRPVGEGAVRQWDPDLHLWGRPFLIPSATPAEVSASYDAYRSASLATAVGLAESAQAIISGSAEGIEPAEVIDEQAGTRERARLAWRLDLLRHSYRALARKHSVRLGEDVELDPMDVLATETAPTLIAVALALRPGWMARGYVWPSYILSAAGVPIEGVFENGAGLFGVLGAELPEVTTPLARTLEPGQRLGAFVMPANVGRLCDHLRDHHEALMAWAAADGWETHLAVEVGKLNEALDYARSHGLGFLEAADLYTAAVTLGG